MLTISKKVGKMHSIIGFVYMVAGVAVANGQGYFANLTTLPNILAAVLAVVLWPLLIMGINLHNLSV